MSNRQKMSETMSVDWHFPYPSQRMPILAPNCVATSQPLAAQAGLEILRQGGNAVDAALATAITLAVVEPTGNGLGSDCFAIVWDGERLHGWNGSGRSPQAWSPARFTGRDRMPELGWDTVTVPGVVDGWVSLSGRFGRLPFGDLFGPAVRYATDGFLVSPVIAGRWAQAPALYAAFPAFAPTFLPHGRAPLPGTRFKPPGMAATLEEIAKTAGESFYRGALAAKIVAAAAAGGGCLTREDLASHRGEWVTPLSQAFQGVLVHELPPNGQGLNVLVALGLLSHLPLGRHPIDAAESLHLQIEAMKLAFALARPRIADPAWMKVPPGSLLEEGFLEAQAQAIRPDRAQFPTPPPPREGGTVYLAAADASGMMVSYIQSNYHGFGSGIVIPGTGISLQNRGIGFTLEVGHPNEVAGGKRPYHTIIPGFVTKDGAPLMAFGVMGAHMQAQGHLQMLVRICAYGQNPQAAADAPRWFLTEDSLLALEPGISPGVREALAKLGHRLAPEMPTAVFGGAQLIYRLEDGYCAASDPRKDGQAVGF